MEELVRPQKIYLDEPIEIKGIKVHHTEEGLKYLVDHYTELLSRKVSEKVRSKDVADHMRWLIENWKQHLILYECTHS